jgi:hypothetical protein
MQRLSRPGAAAATEDVALDHEYALEEPERSGEAEHESELALRIASGMRRYIEMRATYMNTDRHHQRSGQVEHHRGRRRGLIVRGEAPGL